MIIADKVYNKVVKSSRDATIQKRQYQTVLNLIEIVTLINRDCPSYAKEVTTMPSEDLRALIARANNDKDFLRDLLKNPAQAIKEAGFELTPEEMEAVKSSQFQEQLSDEELDNRASKILFKLGG